MSIAASAAASVVWLTAELAAATGSALAAAAFGALAGLVSDFFVVTVAFVWSAAVFAADALDTGFALDVAGAALVPAFGAAAALVVLVEDFSAATLAFVTFALAVGFTGAAFFAGALAGAVLAAAFDGAALAVVLVEVVVDFAGFFIALAMEINTNKGCLAMQAPGSAVPAREAVYALVMQEHPHRTSARAWCVIPSAALSRDVSTMPSDRAVRPRGHASGTLAGASLRP